MIRNKKITTSVFIALLLFFSCVKEEIYDTAHPDKGQITLVTDWSKKGEGIAAPESYTAQIGDYAVVLKGDHSALPHLFTPETYRMLVYNPAEKISVKDETATVETTTNGYMESLPGWFFSHAGEVTVEKDRDYTFTATMQQQVRELNLWIEPTGGTVNKVGSVTAELSGGAQQLNLRDGTLRVEKNISLTFAKQPDGKYKATARLLGFVSAMPKLTVKIAFAGGSPSEITQDYDLGNQLKTFNVEKNKPFPLGAQLMEMPTAAGFIITLTDWKTVKEGNGIAD